MTRFKSSLAEIVAAARFFRHLPGFLQTPLTPEACHSRVREALKSRESNFIKMLEQAVFSRPASPYHKLLKHAGASLGDVRALVRSRGLEAALGVLYNAGVYVTLPEFKGRTPLRRGSLEIEAGSRDFDNPMIARQIELHTGGSSGKATPLIFNLKHYEQEAVYDFFFLRSFEILDRPYGIWRPPPPYHAGIWAILDQAKLGRSTDKWFAQDQVSLLSSETWRGALVVHGAGIVSRLSQRSLPIPEHVPLDEAWRVAKWLAAVKGTGRPALFNTNASSGLRICLAARKRGIDISGTLFRFGGEPLTPAKARVVAEMGSQVVCHYGGGEAGRLGIACRHGEALDDVHLLLDKIALIQRPPAAGNAEGALANVLTTLLPTTPKLMLNFENGDCGLVEERRCGCFFQGLGYSLHLHSIRSFGKLTSEGMNFLGHDLIRLIEEVLPARFGGGPTDYQMVEDEDADGLPIVQLFISPRVGPLSEPAIAEAVIAFLNEIPATQGRFGERWRDAQTLSIVRREPLATSASKVLALHTVRKAAAAHEHV